MSAKGFAGELAIVVAAQVRLLRKQRGLSQCDLAHRVNALAITVDPKADLTGDRTSNRGFCREHIARIERAVYVPSLQTLQRIARALGTDLPTMLACVDGMVVS